MEVDEVGSWGKSDENGTVWSWKLGKGLKKLEKWGLEIGKPGKNWKSRRWYEVVVGEEPGENGTVGLESWRKF